MRERTATAQVMALGRNVAQAAESAGPCPNVGCGGKLEIRHERMYGRVYAAFPTCEQRVLEVKQLRDNIARMQAERDNLRVRVKSQTTRQAISSTRNDEIVERYQAGEPARTIAADLGLTSERVRQILVARGVPRRRGARRLAS